MTTHLWTSSGHRNSKKPHRMVDTNYQDMVYTFSLEEVSHALEHAWELSRIFENAGGGTTDYAENDPIGLTFNLCLRGQVLAMGEKRAGYVRPGYPRAEIAGRIIAAANEVHNHIGPGYQKGSLGGHRRWSCRPMLWHSRARCGSIE